MEWKELILSLMKGMKLIGSLPMLDKPTILLLRGSLAKVFMSQLGKIGMIRSKKSFHVPRGKSNKMMVLVRLLSQLNQMMNLLETQVILMLVMQVTLELQITQTENLLTIKMQQNQNSNTNML
jgi:hypothetical protein